MILSSATATVDATYPQREAASVFTAVVSSLLLIHHGGGNRVDSAAVVGCCYGMIDAAERLLYGVVASELARSNCRMG